MIHRIGQTYEIDPFGCAEMSLRTVLAATLFYCAMSVAGQTHFRNIQYSENPLASIGYQCDPKSELTVYSEECCCRFARNVL